MELRGGTASKSCMWGCALELRFGVVLWNCIKEVHREAASWTCVEELHPGARADLACESVLGIEKMPRGRVCGLSVLKYSQKHDTMVRN